MAKRKTYFKADASSEIGYGHFIRTLALADMLKEDFDCTFFTSEPNEFQRSEVAKVCMLYSLSFKTAQDEFLSILQGDEIVVLDNYYYTSEYQKQIKELGCSLVCIDDIHDKHFYADVIINHAPGIVPEEYDIERYTQLCLGTDYLLLRKEFFHASTLQIKRTVHRTFICFGGSDEQNLTLQACKVLKGIVDCEIIVVVGGGYLFMDELQECVQNYNIRVYSDIDAIKMVELLLSSSLAIVPASTIFFETCCARIPIITGWFVDNQMLIAKGCEELGLGYNCGNLLVEFDRKLKKAWAEIQHGKDEEYIDKQNQIINISSCNLLKIFKEL